VVKEQDIKEQDIEEQRVKVENNLCLYFKVYS
jgi:hypothetical protein